MLTPIYTKRLDISGYNACLLQIKDGYTGLVRNTTRAANSTFGINTIAQFTLDCEFNTLSYNVLEDRSNRHIYRSWTSGPEDPRLISPNEFYAVTCDTNDRWQAEISKITFSEGVITSVVPQVATDRPRGVEKNWILLNSWGTERHLLYSCHPFRILRLDDRTGAGHIFFEYTLPGIHLNAHNGAAVALDDGFLVSARIKEGYAYKHSVWLKFDRAYKCVGISPPFRFLNDGALQSDGSFRPGGYEMNMSTHREEDLLVCCVGINDSYNLVVKYRLEDVLQFIHPLV